MTLGAEGAEPTRQGRCPSQCPESPTPPLVLEDTCTQLPRGGPPLAQQGPTRLAPERL